MNTFKNSSQTAIGTSQTTIYTAPALTTTTLIGLSIANITLDSTMVDVTLTDDSASTETHLIKNAPITSGSTLVVIGGEQKIVLETADSIKVTAADSSSVDVIMSMLEQT